MSTNVTIVVIEQIEPQQDVFTFRELCEHTGVHGEFVVKLVSYGIISPLRDCSVADWSFDLNALVRLQKAQRLQRDLKINLPGLAMSLDLLEDVHSLRREVDRLNQQLRQFTGLI